MGNHIKGRVSEDNLISIDAIGPAPHDGQARLRGPGVRAAWLRRYTARPRLEASTTSTPCSYPSYNNDRLTGSIDYLSNFREVNSYSRFKSYSRAASCVGTPLLIQ